MAASVFARLKVPSPDGSGAVDDHGVHAFVVPLRDAGGRPLPGVEIKDCGYKARTCLCLLELPPGFVSVGCSSNKNVQSNHYFILMNR